MTHCTTPHPLLRLPIAALLATVLSLSACAVRQGAHTSAFPPTAWVADSTLAFVENRGQWDRRALYRARTESGSVWVTRSGITLQLHNAEAGRTSVVSLEFGEARAQSIRGQGLREEQHHYLRGDDARWRTGLRAYRSIVYRQLHPGVDLQLRENGGQLEYDVLLAPHADLSQLTIGVRGIQRLDVDQLGRLVMRTQDGEIVQSVPTTWQVDHDGTRIPVTCSYVLQPGNAFGFALDQHRPELETVVDPGLDWSTLLGGSSWEFGWNVARVPTGGAIVAGETPASNFPTTAGAFDTTYNGVGGPTSDVFVSRIAADGTSLVYSTYLGGSSGDKPYGLAVRDDGTVTIVGNTQSSNFPTTPGAFDGNLNGSSDGFVSRIDPTGSQLVFSTFLGGSSGDVAQALALSRSGEAVVTGVSSSSDFPVTNGTYGTSPAGSSDAFITRLTNDGTSLRYSTLIGGSSGDVAQAAAVAPDDSVTIAGVTSSSDFPTSANAFQSSASGGSDAFVLQLDADATNLVYATLLGGSQGDVAEAVDVDGSGAAVVVGVSSSNNFPSTPGALTGGGGSSDAFVTKVSPDGSSLVFSARVGGSKGDVPKSVAIDRTGAVVLGGQTSSSNFPTTPEAIQTAALGSADAFLVRLSPDGSGLLYATYHGGSGSDGGEDCSGDANNLALLAGVAGSNNFPTSSGAVQENLSGNSDSFCTQIDMDCGFSVYGAATSGCARTPTIGVTACPRAGATDFGFAGTNAPPNAFGLLIVGTHQATSPSRSPSDQVAHPRAALHVNLEQAFASFVVASDDHGHFTLPLPLEGAAGAQLYGQVLWANSPGCSSATTFSASPGLALSIQ